MNRRQFKCSTCGKPFSETLDFIGSRRKYTDRYAEVVVQQVMHSSTKNVAWNQELSEDIIWLMVEYVSKKGAIELRGLRRLGIDEIALRKGHKEFVVVLVDLDHHQLLGMAESHTHASIKAVLAAWSNEVLTQIEEVSIDLSGSYRGLVHRLMHQATVVADRSHVMKLVNQELNQARNVFIRQPTDYQSA